MQDAVQTDQKWENMDAPIMPSDALDSDNPNRREENDTVRPASPIGGSPSHTLETVDIDEGSKGVPDVDSQAGHGLQDEVRPASPSVSALTSRTAKTSRSGSSSGSGSTITQGSFTRHRCVGKGKEPDTRFGRKSSPSRHSPPDPLVFLEPDSPAVTEETIQRSIEESSRWRMSSGMSGQSPSARSSGSSSSGFRSEVFSEPVGDHGTDRSSSPEHSIDGGSPSVMPEKVDQQCINAPRTGRSRRNYGTPEMPRGNANLPHLPTSALQPRFGGNHPHVKHLPRAEKLPLTGYELVASKLSIDASGFSTISPMYRRFEALNHRLLLHLQDELAELEEQLHRLDTADTQTRRLQNCILPASRRSEFLAGGELQWHKTDILGKIGFKLEQYNHVLASFTKTQELPPPSLADIGEYRSYLATHNPIAEIETRFLDSANDLVSLGRPGTSSSGSSRDSMSDGAPTPMPHSVGDGPFHLSCPNSDSGVSELAKSMVSNERSQQVDVHSGEPSLPHLAVAVAVSVLLPILTFSVIPGFLGRMTVVALVAIAVLGPLTRVGGVSVAYAAPAVDTRSMIICAGLYGTVMAVIASIFA